MTKRKNIFLMIMAAVMAFALTAAILLFNPVQTAFAERSSTAWTTIGEIYNDSTKGFNEDNLKKLYKALTGTDTFASVQSAAGSGKTSADFRTTNGGTKNVSVWFGGKKWDAVYLTTAQNGGGDTSKGDVILDLWQSADNIDKQKVGFLDWDADRTDVSDTYPANMYSTSTLRVKTLNAGGYCLTSKNKLGSKQEQDSNNQYARFTMSTVGNSLTAYIATPAEVGYQEHEFDANTVADITNQVYKQEKTYYLPNDAYGAPNTGGEWYSTDYGNLYNNKDGSRVDEAKYGAWKDDYLWIPSITEAGCSATGTGLWKTDFSLRSSAGTQGTDWTWFRSGYSSDEKYSNTDYYFFVFVIGVLAENNNHADWSNLTSTDPNFVRPALHLNLTAANKKAESAWKSVGEINNDGSSSFNRDNMQALYTALTGSGSYGDVRTALSGGNKTSADFREKNDGQNVQVTFGGIKWDAVYLTKATNGDFILDLWQSVDSVTEKSKWADRSSDGVGSPLYSDNPNASYPDNMYSTSYIRINALNVRGQYSTSGTALSGAQGQDPNNPYARFTMESVANSLTAYLAKPVEVGYQADEFDLNMAKLVTESHYTPNDAYGTLTSGSWAQNSTTKFSYNYNGKGSTEDGTNYTAWQNDYLWLPSMTETGCRSAATGIWQTDATLRNSGTVPIWLRSGDDNWAANAYALEPTGDNQHYYVYYEYDVRPAIHLNLTAINNSLKKVVEAPENVSKTYTGGNLTSGITDTTEYTVSEDSVTDVGVYDVKLELKYPDDYKWQGEDPNKDSITLSFEITTAENEWTSGGVTVDGGGWTYGDTGKLSAPSQFGAATYTYTHEDNQSGQYYAEAPTAAGHYFVKATVPAGVSTKDPTKNNYDELVSDPVRFEIRKAELDKPTGTKILNETYKGTPYEIEISGYESDKMTATRSDNTKSTFDDTTFAATNAGEYKLTIIITDQSNYMWTGGNSTDEVVFTINIAKATVNFPQGATSTEGQYKPEGYKVTISGYDNALMEYDTTGDGAAFNETEFTAKNVGEYTLTISLKDTDDYEWADKASDPTFTINISKKELEKPTGSANGAYNGADYVVELANYDNDTMQATEAPAGSTFEEDGGTWKFSARDVGTYSITISLRYPDNYKWTGEGADPVITISIGKTQLSFTLKESSKTYTGLQHSDIDVIFEGDFGHLTKDSDYTLSFATSDGVLDGGLPKGTGSYTVTLKLLGTTAQDYDLEKSTATYTIVKAEITFSLKQATATYTGNKHEDIDVNFTGIQNEEAFTKGEHYTLSFAAQSGTTAQLDGTLPKTVGKYTVTVTLLDERAKKNYNVKTVSQTYEINKAQITVSGEYSDSRDYNGEEYEKTITAAGETNGLTVKMPVADPSFEITIATDKSANTYTGKIEVEYDDVNFALTNSGTYTVTINKAKLTLSLTVVDGGKTYDGYDTATVTGEITKGIFNSDDVTIAEIVANFNDKNVGENKPITVTQVTLGGTMADNYTVVIENLPEIKGNISKKTVEVVWSGYEGLIYDGTPKTITASATGVMINGHAEEITLSIEYSAEAGSTLNESNLPQNAGEYTATATTSNGNYALSENTKTYAVAKQQVTAPTIASKVYNRSAQTADVETSALYSIVNEGGTNAGNYNVKLTLTDSKNYTWTTSAEAEITLIFSITKAEYDMSGVTFEDFSIIYDGEEHSIFISGDLPFEEVTVRYENNGQTAVGKYVIKAIFEGDADNYELIPEKTATLTILAVSHDLSNIIFADVKVKYDGEAHEILIEGELPTNVTVAYEGNGQVDPAIYKVTAIFSDPDGVFDTKEATLTILRTQTQTAPKEESGSGGSSSSGGSGESGGGESGSTGESGGESDTDVPEVFIESEEGFDPTLELVVEKVEDTSRSYLAWGADEVSEKYSVKLCNQDGEEVPIEGKVTVRLLIPEAFRDKDFDLMALAKSGAATASYARGGVQTVAADLGSTGGATSVSFIRDGDYVVFEADGLSEYVFTSSYTPYFPIIIAATGVLLADVAAMVVLAVVIRKKLQRKAR